jgi:hypothetical protein
MNILIKLPLFLYENKLDTKNIFYNNYCNISV